jgi:VPDSG-CTERM motif
MLILSLSNLRWRSPVFAALFLFVFANGALADRIRLTGHTDYRDGVGGEFNIKPYDQDGKTLLEGALSSGYVSDGLTPGNSNGTRMNAGFGGLLGFQTFCIEYNEYISLDGIYEAAISNGSIFGGVGGGVDPDGGGPLPRTDIISIGTAYLYTLFATKALDDYDYTNGSGRESSAVMLQKAFWYLEDEISLTDAQKNANLFLTGAEGALTVFGSVAAAKADNDFNLYHVRVMNLWSGNDATHPNQDQLIMVPDGGATAILLGLALTALARLRRKSD